MTPFMAIARPQWATLYLLIHLPFTSTFLLRNRVTPFHTGLGLHSSLTSSEALLEALQSNPRDEKQIATCIANLESSSSSSESTTLNNNDDNGNADFDPLLGLYEVSHVKTQRAIDNPIGGKWTRKSSIAQRLFRTRRSFQHILPTNSTGLGNVWGEGRTAVVAEAVNVISLEALFGLIRLFVILRGDAIPLTFQERTNTTRVTQTLSPLAVKVLFDAPRIAMGKKGRFPNINLGPKTIVLLDTLYCDDKLRLGMGGTSGSRLVFKRCRDNDEEANEFRALLQNPPIKKYKSFLSLGGIATLGLVGVARGFFRLLSCATAVVAVSLAVFIAFSGGGIERGDMGVIMRKEEEANSHANLVI